MLTGQGGASESLLPVAGLTGPGKTAVTTSILWHFLQGCPKVDGWQSGTDGASLVLMRRGRFQLPRELCLGYVTFECIAMKYVPRDLWPRATEILHTLPGKDGFGCWDANVGGCVDGSGDPFSDCVVRFTHNEIKAKKPKTAQMIALREAIASAPSELSVLTPDSPPAEIDMRICMSIVRMLGDWIKHGPVDSRGMGVRSTGEHDYSSWAGDARKDLVSAMSDPKCKNQPGLHGDGGLKLCRRSVEEKLFQGGNKYTPLIPTLGNTTRDTKADRARGDPIEAWALVQEGQGAGGADAGYAFVSTPHEKGGPPRSSGARPFTMRLSEPVSSATGSAAPPASAAAATSASSSMDATSAPSDPAASAAPPAVVEEEVTLMHRGSLVLPDREAAGGGGVSLFYDTGIDYDFQGWNGDADSWRERGWGAGWADDRTLPLALPSTKPQLCKKQPSNSATRIAVEQAAEQGGLTTDAGEMEGDCLHIGHCMRFTLGQRSAGGTNAWEGRKGFTDAMSLQRTPNHLDGGWPLLVEQAEEWSGEKFAEATTSSRSSKWETKKKLTFIANHFEERKRTHGQAAIDEFRDSKYLKLKDLRAEGGDTYYDPASGKTLKPGEAGHVAGHGFSTKGLQGDPVKKGEGRASGGVDSYLHVGRYLDSLAVPVVFPCGGVGAVQATPKVLAGGSASHYSHDCPKKAGFCKVKSAKPHKLSSLSPEQQVDFKRNLATKRGWQLHPDYK